MSGGHFDYKCFHIADFADELERAISKNSHKFGEETLSHLVIVLEVLETAAALAKEAEWLYSGDTGEDSFKSNVDRILAE